jgi:hypothetical protein
MEKVMIVLRSLLLLATLLLLPHLSWGEALDDFRRALSELQVGKRFTPRDYLHCTGGEEACNRMEGGLGTVQIEIELLEGIISNLLIVAEEVKIDQELLPILQGLYGSGEKKLEGIREARNRPELALTIAAARYASYEWQRKGARIILFCQDPFRVIHDDGREEVTEPMKTYVSGDLVPPR